MAKSNVPTTMLRRRSFIAGSSQKPGEAGKQMHQDDPSPRGRQRRVVALTSLVAKSGIPALFPLANDSMQLVFRGNDSHIYHASTTDGVSYGNSTQDAASITNHAAIPFENWGAAANWVFYVGVNNELFTVLEQQ
jgi:hypothetical protein